MEIARRTFVIALAATVCPGAAENRELRSLLAPTGTLRVGVYPGRPTSLVRDGSGEARGVTVELGRSLAQQLGVPFAMVEYPRIAEVLAALKDGAVDVTVPTRRPRGPRAQSSPSLCSPWNSDISSRLDHRSTHPPSCARGGRGSA